MTIAMQSTTRGNITDREYDAFRERMQRRFAAYATEPLFTTDTAGLWDAYLAAFPEGVRQHHRCSACKRFIETYGGLVTIDEKGRPNPAFWSEDDADDTHREPVRAIVKHLRGARVTGVFLSSDATWGQPITGPWTHLSLTPPPFTAARHVRTLLTARQKMAERREDFKTLQRAIEEFRPEHIALALTLLRSDALYRSEKVLGQAEFLAKLHEDIRTGDRANVVWRALAKAPAGFCHPRASMIGTLLEDIAAGLDFGDVSRKFAAKMHPLQYQRPTAPPSAGNIAQAEKIVAELGVAGSLERRFARLEECETIWKPKARTLEPAAGVFGHLTPKGETLPGSMVVPSRAMTWVKFRDTVLPNAATILLAAPAHGNYCALVTATNPDAPPILQWDTLEHRNPVSWYVYNGGSSAQRWCLMPAWIAVTAIALQPSMWGGRPAGHQGESAIFVLAGARDTSYETSGLGIFPETLKSEFHGIRSTIEAFSRRGKLGGYEEASACGLRVGDGSGAHVRVRDAAGVQMEYRIDRWS